VEVGRPILLMPSVNLASIDGSGLEVELSGGKEARSNTTVFLGPIAPIKFGAKSDSFLEVTFLLLYRVRNRNWVHFRRSSSQMIL
jgi:hypothetical protein